MTRAARVFAFTFSAALFGVGGCGGGSPESDAASPTDGGAGGVDANVDAARDAGGGCAGDLDCNDGLFCNGDERCVSGACAAGAAPTCADTVACTRDFCSEDRRACEHQVPDEDADGHGAASCVDGAGVALGDDCDDTDDNTFPGNLEVCDSAMHDEDCRGSTHGDVDHDSDGFEDAACCNGVECGRDCDDSNRSVNPMGIEACDHLDNNCNNQVDEMLGLPMYPDADRDGWGDASRPTVVQCNDTVGFAVRGGDCDDMRLDRNPGQLEVCDVVDNDCDVTVDENTGNVPWYVDADRDSYGDPTAPTLVQCAPPTGSYSLVGTDCDDTTSSRSPRAPEVCNAIDDDCNGQPDFLVGSSNFEDDDRDRVADLDCGGALGRDCNDRDATALPNAAEICNGRDDDCDTRTDEDATSAAYHRDADMDGYGDRGTTVFACSAPSGYVTDATDCDDALATRRPGASETCNATDDDCDRRIDETPAASSCSLPNAVAACTVGICHATGCQPGFSDCTLADGCETETVANDLRCGGCARVCGAGREQCADSLCVPSDSDDLVALSSRDDVGSAVAFDGTRLALGATFNGPRFGIGCGSHFDAQGSAGAISLRDAQTGTCMRTLAIDGMGDEVVTALAFDPGGDLFVALTTTSTSLQVGGMGANAGTGQGARDAVIARLDSTLTALWVRRIGGTFDDGIQDLAVSGTDLWAVGAMRGPVAFGGPMLAPTTMTDSVIVHLGTANGATLHALSSSTSGADGALGVALDATNVYVVGVLAGSGMFGTTSLASSGPTDGYLWTLLRTDGGSVRARAFGGTGADQATSVAVRAGTGANIAVVGSFEGMMTIDGAMLTSAGMQDGFVAGLDATSMGLWAISFGGPTKDSLDDVAVSGGFTGPFSVVGTFGGAAQFSGSGTTVRASGGTDGIFFGVDTTGTPSPSEPLGGVGNDSLRGVAAMPTAARFFVAGSYSGTWHWLGTETTYPADGGLEAMWLGLAR